MIEHKGLGLCGYEFNSDYDCKQCENYEYCKYQSKKSSGEKSK